MANATWIGSTDDDANKAANWNPASVPVNGDHLIFNSTAQSAMLTNIDAGTFAGVTFSVNVASGFTYYIGTGALPFEPAEGFTTIVYSGSGVTPSHFSADAGKTITRGIVDTSSQLNDVCVFQGAGSIDQVIVRSGKAKLNATTVTANGRIEVLGTGGSSTAELNIPTGITLTSVDVGMQGGSISCSSDAPGTVRVNGGVFVLAGGADLATLETHGGTFYWDAADVTAASTITEAEIFGGAFIVREDRAGRTLTNMNVYTSGTANFSIGGLSVTFTNAVRNLGGSFIQPMGSSWTIGA